MSEFGDADDEDFPRAAAPRTAPRDVGALEPIENLIDEGSGDRDQHRRGGRRPRR